MGRLLDTAPSRVASTQLNQVNRAHWPTKENRQCLCAYFAFFRSMEKMAWDDPKWGQEDFFLLIQTLPTFWAKRILILRIFIFLIFLDPRSLAWAQLGPDLGPGVGPAWAHPLGPTVGPPTWAPRVGQEALGWALDGPRKATAVHGCLSLCTNVLLQVWPWC